MRPPRVPVIFVLLLGLLPALVHAAEVTDLKDAFDGKTRWSAGLEVSYVRTQRWAKISRERSCDPNNAQDKANCPNMAMFIDTRDLTFSQVDHAMMIRARLGLAPDLELTVTLPYVFSSTRSGGLADGVVGACQSDGSATAETNSGIVKDGVFTGGRSRPPSDKDEYSVYGVDSFGTALGGRPCLGGKSGVPYSSTRGGIGDLIVGIGWAPVNQDRDTVKSTWVLGLDFIFPTGTPMDPTPTAVALGNFSPRNQEVGKGLFAFRWYTTFAHRVHPNVEPYAGLDFEMAFAGRGNFYRQIAKTQDTTAPPVVAGTMAGIEFYPWWDRDKARKFSIDVRLRMTYVGEGRAYSEVADFLGRMTTVEQYMTLGGSLSMYLQPVKNFQIRVVGGIEYQFDHFLTFGDRGKDLDGNQRIDPQLGEKSPTFDDNTDKPGSRLRILDSIVFSLMFTLVGQF
ncbi:MAG: hypothetical protein HYY84_02880 [Deltaproteobacteria bacterium]|nr:hypothetical protein [Deltaproteobacteria bacterium]